MLIYNYTIVIIITKKIIVIEIIIIKIIISYGIIIMIVLILIVIMKIFITVFILRTNEYRPFILTRKAQLNSQVIGR